MKFTPKIPPIIDDKIKDISLIRETIVTESLEKINEIIVRRIKDIIPFNIPTKYPLDLLNFPAINPPNKTPKLVLINDNTNFVESLKSIFVYAMALKERNKKEKNIENINPKVNGFISFLENKKSLPLSL